MGADLVVFRGESGAVHALAAHCPHLGAPLQVGCVRGETLRCPLHGWNFDGAGRVRAPTPYPASPDRPIIAYPAQERFGCIWVWSGRGTPDPFTLPRELGGGEIDSIYLGTSSARARPYNIMATIVDVNHFAVLHRLTGHIEYSRDAKGTEWTLNGTFNPRDSLASRVGSWLLGPRWGFRVRFGGGSIAALTYGHDLRIRGRPPARTPLFLLTGFVPRVQSGCDAHIFLLQPKRFGALGFIKTWLWFGVTLLLASLFNSDDRRILNDIQLDPRGLVPSADDSVRDFFEMIENLPSRPWPPANARSSGTDSP